MSASAPTPLGKGTYGNVVQIDGTAVKYFEYHKPLIQEYAALKYIANTGCKYQVKVLDVDIQKCRLTMELYDMDLRKWRYQNFSDIYYQQDVKVIIHDILCGLIELHDRGLAHGDLKPGNILVKKQPLKAVLGDAGFVSIAKYTKVDRTGPLYRDPIPIKDVAHDMFSFGMILFELVTGQQLIKLGKHNDYQNIAMTYVKDLEYQEIIVNLFQAKHQQRYTARELLYRLYHEDYPIWTVPSMVVNITPNPGVKEMFTTAARKYGIPREKLGSQVLLLIRPEPDLIDIAAMLYLLTAMFIADPVLQVIAPRRFTESEALQYAQCDSEQLCQRVIDLIDDERVIQVIMSCATRTHNKTASSSTQ